MSSAIVVLAVLMWASDEAQSLTCYETNAEVSPGNESNFARKNGCRSISPGPFLSRFQNLRTLSVVGTGSDLDPTSVHELLGRYMSKGIDGEWSF